MTGLALHLGARLVDHARDAAVILSARAELAAAHPRLALRAAVRVLFGGAS